MLAASAALRRQNVRSAGLKPRQTQLRMLTLERGHFACFRGAQLGPMALAVVSCRSLRAKATASVATARVRESGMPVVDWWEQLVNPESTLDLLGLTSGRHATVVEFGCGYGTFTIPVAQRVQQLYSFDIDQEMVSSTRQRMSQYPLVESVQLEVRDVVANGYGLGAAVDAVLLMNILHCEAPVQMLQDAADLLKPGGLVYATHWRYDSSTPRGPPMDIRPRPEQLEEWAVQTGLLEVASGPIDCPPWHYGYTFRRKAEE